MTPGPKTSSAAPYRWVGAVVLDAQEVEDLLHGRPAGSPLGDQLQAADRMADRLNLIEHGRAA